MARSLLLVLAVAAAACNVPAAGPPADAVAPTPIADRYRDVSQKILDAALRDERAWRKLEHLTDRIGPRLAGSPALDEAIAWAAATLTAEGHEAVRAEKVTGVPHWERGGAAAELVAPVRRDLHVLALGGSAGTAAEGVTSEVVVVRTFDELDALGAAAVRGKIVLFDHRMAPFGPSGTGYGAASRIRLRGPQRAAALGAAAVLVRSATARSLGTPHTGVTIFGDTPPIPAATLTLEDADLVVRLAGAGPVSVRLALGARSLPDVESANVVAELRGRELPHEIVVISAHIDSWDVGQGAHDDGGGCAMMMQALTLLRELGLRPRRTIRVVLFTNEENGLRGAEAYAEAHAAELPRHVAALEADLGAFRPLGFTVEGMGPASEARLRDVASLLAPIGATEVTAGYAGTDIGELEPAGVPLLGLSVDASTYFDLHHTHADTLDKVSPDDLRRDVAAVAVIAYVLADMPGRLGRD